MRWRKKFWSVSLLLLHLASAKKVPKRQPESLNTQPRVALEDVYVPKECPRRVKKDDYVFIEYVALIDESTLNGERGKQFDSSIDGHPFHFQVEITTHVMPGLHLGVKGMCKVCLCTCRNCEVLLSVIHTHHLRRRQAYACFG